MSLWFCCLNVACETHFLYSALQKFVQIIRFLCQQGAPKCLLLLFIYTCEHNQEFRAKMISRFYKRTTGYILFHSRRSDAFYRDVVSMEFPFLDIQSERCCVYKRSDQRSALLNKSNLESTQIHVLPTSVGIVRLSCMSEGAT